MSVAESQVPLKPLADWLPTLAAAGILELTGAAAWARARTFAGRIKGTPRAIGGKLVRSEMELEDGRIHAVNVGLGTEGALACLCDCDDFSRSPPCGHVAGLLLALANDPPLRDSLSRRRAIAGEDDARQKRRRADARELLRRRGIDPEAAQRRLGSPRLLDLTFDVWRRRGAVRPIGPATFTIRVEHDGEDAEEPPRLRVRIVPEGTRKPFGPDDLESRRLPAREWRLLEPLAHSPSGAREFSASGVAACTFLARAVEAGIALDPHEPDAVAAVSAATVRPSLSLREPRPAELSAHKVVAAARAERRDLERELHDAWTAYTAVVEPIDEKGFLAALDISLEPAPPRDVRVVEARWVAAADLDDAPTYLPLPTPLADSVVFRGPTSWVYLRNARTFARIAEDVGPIALSRLSELPTVLVDREDIGRLPALLSEHFLREGIGLPRREDLGLPPLPKPRVILRAGGSIFSVEARLEAIYGEARFSLTPESCADIWDDTRDGDAERAAIDALAATALRRWHRAGRRRPRPAGDGEEGMLYRAEGERAVRFWTQDLPAIVAHAGHGGPIDEVVVPAELRDVTVREPVRSKLTVRATKTGLLDVALAFGAEGIPADVAEIRAAMEAKRRWIRLTDGSIASLSGRVAELVAASAGQLGGGAIELPRHSLGETRLWSDLADEASVDETVTGWTERLRALAVSPRPQPVRGLRAELRAYQEAGLAWLQFLADLGVGGILADDMGLGKTIQALAVVAWRRERDGPAPSLIVAPTSVAPNWIREANRFVPELRPLLLHGTSRHSHREGVPESDIVVTTYALLRRDIQQLRGIRFRYVILDEAQHIKNHTAATTAAARALDAESRLALTGTPLENRLLELWSIVDFVNPGMLGTWRAFSRKWERPVEEAVATEVGAGLPTEPAQRRPAADVSGNAQAASLRARIRPFLLRRTKAEVQKDLPPKIETDVVVDLTPAQRRAYAALAAATREDLGRRLSADGIERSQMVILTALLRLRQMACDPRLVDPRHRPEDSAKLGAFRELVSEVIASGRRALIFSQFVQLLALLRQDLEAQEIEYAYLDGRTRDREATIEGFVQGDMPLFLLSLRAGGTGINLSAADVVIHLDPWWNPAVEDQATDRAHRIGQEKTVSVYRIVAAGTIEEAILRLKERKRQLANAVIGDGNAGLPRGLTEEDIAELLSF